MLIIQVKKPKDDPQWVQIHHKGEVLFITAAMRKDLPNSKTNDTGVSIVFDGPKSFQIVRNYKYKEGKGVKND